MINRLINLLKYPLGIISLLFIFELIRIFFNIMHEFISHFDQYQNFFIGIGLYFVLWFILFPKKFLHWFSILEHELAHTIFALLTFHKIHGVCALNRYGGFMIYGGGKGNWLINLAPYFFSTFGFVTIGLIHLSNPRYYPFLVGLLGYVFFHHIHNTFKTARPYQSDLKKSGLLFSYVFLPSANLLMLILLLTQVPNDQIDFQNVLGYLYDLSDYYITQLAR